MKQSTFFILLAMILSLTFASGPLGAQTTKWVDQAGGSDGNDGNTEATAYATLQFAIDNSLSGTAGNRSVIYVKDGTYGQPGQATTCEYSLPAAIVIDDLDYLTIQAVAGHEPVVKPQVASETNVVSVTIIDSDHLIIDNIDSDQTVAQFDNWHVCNSNDLTVRNCDFEGGEDGIDFNTSLTTALIENNLFKDVNTGSGDEVLDFTDATYSAITIQDNTFLNNYRHITINPPSGHTASNFIIRRNFMDGTTSQEGVRFNDGGGPVSDVILENNVIMNSRQQGLYVKPPVSNITVRHNSFFNSTEEELRLREAAGDVFLKNNIIYANGTHAAISARAPFPPGPLPMEDYNLIYNAGTATESGSAAPITVFGANTIVGADPLFVSTTPGSEDLHLQLGSPAAEAGTDLGVSEDFDKSPRPNPSGTNPDMGAFELGPPPNEPPICSNAAPSIAFLWPPNHKFVAIDVLGVTDPDGDEVTITITGIFQDEPVNGSGDGNFAPDGQGVGTATAEVRAERDGSRNGRVYHIRFSADDGNGGTCSGEVLVGVPKSQGPNGGPVDDGPLYDSTVPSLAKNAGRTDLPLSFALLDAYPNPFNPQTNIAYQLPKTSSVTLKIFNIRGELVRTLVEGFKAGGSHAVVWDGRDDRGVRVSSGTYLYRITADNFVQTRKMILLR